MRPLGRTEPPREEVDLGCTDPNERRNVSSLAAGVVIAAGDRLLDYFGEVGGVAKGRFDLVTRADVAVEELMLAELQRQFSNYQVIAEESTGLGTDSIQELCWVIDPLDGTVNFAMGIPIFSVSLALLRDGDPVLGLVYDPVREELFQAQRGGGSSVNGRTITVPAGTSSPVPVGASSGFLGRGGQAGPPSPLVSVMRRFGKMRILGSQALHLCYVAAGRLRAAISWESRLWDDAAGALIAQEAGAQYTDFWGCDVFPLEAGCPVLAGEPIHSLAACPSVHREMVEILAAARADDSAEPEERTS